MTKSQKVTLVSSILKLRIPALTISESIDLAFDIVNKLEENEH